MYSGPALRFEFVPGRGANVSEYGGLWDVMQGYLRFLDGRVRSVQSTVPGLCLADRILLEEGAEGAEGAAKAEGVICTEGTLGICASSRLQSIQALPSNERYLLSQPYTPRI